MRKWDLQGDELERDSRSVILEVRGIRKTYGSKLAPVPALRGADLQVRSGELVAVIGPSGSGKSALLHIIAGLEQPDDGEIVLAGESICGRTENELARIRRHHIGIVFQFFNLLESMTALENVVLPASLAGSPRAEALRRACDLLELLGVADKANSLPAALSGIERQRLAIARALANSPTLLLADEPTGALDSAGGTEILELLRRVNAAGQSMLLVTHDLAVAKTAGRVVSMHDGRIVSACGGDLELGPVLAR